MVGKVLIVDDIPANRMILTVKLASARYDVVQGATGADCLALAQSERPDLILLDILLSDMTGIEVCRRLRADAATRDIPVVMVTAVDSDEARVASFRAGADDVFSKPLDDLVLLARIRSLLRAREAVGSPEFELAGPASLGLAEAAAPFQPRANMALVASARASSAPSGLQQALALDGASLSTIPRDEALDDFGGRPAPDLILIPADIAERGDGLLLMSELHSRQPTRHSAVCILASDGARDSVAMAFDLGAFDVIPARASAEEIALRLRAQLGRKQRLDRIRASLAAGLKLSVTDPLTGLYNRRYAFPQLTRIAASGQEFAVLLLDIDRFKSVNDTFGHAAGDSVLVEVARRFRANLRGVDVVARIGGEEFLVVLPACPLADARATAERLRQVVGGSPVRLASGQSVTVTVSAGLAMGGPDLDPGIGIERLVEAADRALLAAKSEGRNQVMIGHNAAA